MCGIVWAYPLYGDGDIESYSLLIDSVWVPEVVLKLLRLNKNRGQDGYGLSILTKDKLTTTKFKKIQWRKVKKTLSNLPSKILGVLWHARYPTSGDDSWKKSMQPFNAYKYKEVWKHGFSFAFNGNIANTDDLIWELEKKGYILKMNGLDTEVLKYMIIDLIKSGTTDFKLILEDVMQRIDGSCNISLMNKKWDLAIAKDLNDFHPLSWSKKEGVFLFSSESSALKWVGCEDIQYLKAGEIVEIKKGKIYQWKLRCKVEKTPCVFEKIYFSDPRSSIHWESISSLRYSLWRKLAREEPNFLDIKNFIVVDVPASSHHQAEGFAQELNISNIPAITKNPDIWSTFLEKKSKIADKVRMKYIFNPELKKYIEGRDVYIVDDSIVRGSTMSYLIEQFKKFFNPRSVHIRIPSPPVGAPCFYGINMSTIGELLAPRYIKNLMTPKQKELREMGKNIGSDSLNYLSLWWLAQVIWDVEIEKLEVRWACMACLTGIYPTPKWRELYELQKN